MPDFDRFFLFRAQKPLAIFGLIYVLSLAVLAVPYFQRHVLYLHQVKWPLFAKFDKPEKYGMAPGKTIQLKLPSTDGVTLGAWLTIAEPYFTDNHHEIHHLLSDSSKPPHFLTVPSVNISAALTSHPTILFFHGNAATRAVSYRTTLQRLYASALKSNILFLDYRGFADSTGSPTQDGVVDDAQKAWEWLMENGAREENISVVGMSLGTAIGTQLCERLRQSGEKPRALVLIAPFTSLGKLLETYNLFGFLPLAKPLQSIPFAFDLFKWFIVEPWDTRAIIQNVESPLILVHAVNDMDVPPAHSASLFAARLLEDHVANTPELPFPQVFWEQETIDIEGLGKLRITERASLVDGKEKTKRTVWLESNWGGHNDVAGYEGVLEILKSEIGTLLSPGKGSKITLWD